jgi:hypothetical protein
LDRPGRPSRRGRLAGLVEVAPHLGKGLAAGRLDRVVTHALDDVLGLRAGVERLAGERRVRVGRTDDLLALECSGVISEVGTHCQGWQVGACRVRRSSG